VATLTLGQLGAIACAVVIVVSLLWGLVLELIDHRRRVAARRRAARRMCGPACQICYPRGAGRRAA
jgi:hypothetical protein